jgi:hypothetical protein
LRVSGTKMPRAPPMTEVWRLHELSSRRLQRRTLDSLAEPSVGRA